MLKLIAKGAGGQSLRRVLRQGRTLVIGRAPSEPDPKDLSRSIDRPGESCAVEWDPMLSRNHVELRVEESGIKVTRVSGARNPVYYQGQERDRFTLEVGRHFVIGGTAFHLFDEQATLSLDEPAPVDVAEYSEAEIREAEYSDADQRLNVLSSLPHVIRVAANDEDLFGRLTLLLLEGIPSADATAIVRITKGEGSGPPNVDVCHWETRQATPGEFRPSRRLITEAVHTKRQSVRNLWQSRSEPGAEYTMAQDLDWAFCVPVPGDACSGWGLYVAGQLGAASETETDLRPDVKFTELVADVLGAVQDLQHLRHNQAMLGRFFSPVTLPLLSSAGGEQALAPRQTRVTILFCDLRGFSREAERSRDDLLGLLRRVSNALDVMTESIHSHQGVIGDFQGDAALAFWGWPIDNGQAAADACRAALDIRMRFAKAAEAEGDALSGFRCGIGIASGEAVAGRLGTAGQFKIDVFGPVVNLASRLEGITKQLRVPLLVDEATQRLVEEADPGEWARFRRLARIRPYGMEQPIAVSELLPPVAEANVLSAEDAAHYETALDAFNAADWEKAFALLHEVPHWDRGKDFLTSHILKHGRKPPAGWDGVIDIETK